MKKSIFVLLLCVFLGVSTGRVDAGESGDSAFLVQNAGQFDPRVMFQGRMNGSVVWLTTDSVWLTALDEAGGVHLRLDFQAPLDWQPNGRLATRLNSYAGRDPAGWFENIPVWSGAVAGLPGGGRLALSGDGLQISVPAGGSEVELVIEGTPVAVRAGLLQADLPGGAWTLPVHSDGPVRVNGRPADLRPHKDGPAGMETGGELVWSTFIGGINIDEGESVLRDGAGKVYLAGETQSLFFPTAPGPFEALHDVEAFAARMDAGGTELEYLTVFRSDVEDWGTELGLDANGNAYLGGRTDSTDFPTTAGAFQLTNLGGFDAFVVKLDTDGELVYGTLLGGGEDDTGSDLLVDPAGAVYMTGATFSSGIGLPPAFPTTLDAYNDKHNGSRDVFLAKISPAGDALEYGTFAGGSGNEHGEAVAMFGSRLVVAGWTTSDDFAVPAGGYDTELSGSFDAFVFSLTPGNSALDFWSYLGGNDGPSITGERALDLALDAEGAPVLAGSTVAEDFPATPGAFDPDYGGGLCAGSPCSDGFAAKLSVDGSDLLWATFIGGEQNLSGLCDGANQDFGDCDDAVNRIMLEPSGSLILAGVTDSENFPVTGNAFDTTLDGGRDGFIARLAADGGSLPYATFLGGSDVNMNGKGGESLEGVWVDGAGNVTVTGWSDSVDYPTTAGSYDPDHNEDMDVVVTVLALPAPPVQNIQIFLPVILRNQ